MLVGTPEGATNYIDADLRYPGKILRAAAQTLDFSRPIALTIFGVLIFITDDDQAYQIVDRLVDALPSGSYLALTHSTNAIGGAAADEAVRVWNEGGSTPMVLRSPAQMARFFDRLELLGPGIVPLPRWRPDPADIDTVRDMDEFCGVGYKP